MSVSLSNKVIEDSFAFAIEL